jgi:phosphoserine phosphatase RsbU/P
MLDPEKVNILYVDDEEQNLIVFRTAFKKNYNVLTADSAKRGLEILAETEVALIITDQRMPEVTGIQFIQQLPEDQDAIKIILTGFSDVEAIIEAINTGMIYRYITKPWYKDELKITIDNAIEAYFLRQKNKRLIYELKEANENLEQKVIERTFQVNKQKEEIEEKNNKLEKAFLELERKNKEIERKNFDIQSSIRYAQRIQEAMLYYSKTSLNNIQEHFILFQPRDVVSGDFYWFAEKDGKTIVAAVDCTGHGVPGAFMSLIGNVILSQIVNEKGFSQANLILNELHAGIRKVLRHNDSEIRDGMDIALCVIDVNKRKLEYAGAKNPLYLVQDGQMHCVKADLFSVGGLNTDSMFTLHSLDISKQTVLYLFSDGFQDQFGGEENKKYMVKNFRKLLFKISHLSMVQQKHLLETELKNWMGQNEQVDDILVMGLKV